MQQNAPHALNPQIKSNYNQNAYSKKAVIYQWLRYNRPKNWVDDIYTNSLHKSIYNNMLFYFP